MELPENFYRRNKRDSNFHTKNFLLSYRKLIDVDSFNKDRGAYLRLISDIGKRLKDVDFNSNILFICKENISREVFLTGFSTMPNLCSYFYGNIINIWDIYYGNMRDSNPNIRDEDIVYSEQCILDDVMCIHVDKDMYTVKTFDRVLNSVIVSRWDRRNNNGGRLLNWVFFRGTYSDLENSETLSGILRLYMSETGFNVIDLNKSSTSYVKGKVGTKSEHRENDLSDIY